MFPLGFNALMVPKIAQWYQLVYNQSYLNFNRDADSRGVFPNPLCSQLAIYWGHPAHVRSTLLKGLVALRKSENF